MRLLHLLLAPAIALALAATASADLIVTEIVADPQADHSENAGGNGTPFDDVPGTGTVSSVDEYVELYNRGPSAIDLTGYVLTFADTTPASYTFGTTTGGVLRFSGTSTTTALQPGEFVLLGNPPGAMNNTGEVQLYDAVGDLVDALVLIDGNATSALDEAVARLWNGSEFMYGTAHDTITPLAPSNLNIAEPSGAWLALLSLLAVYRASVRTDRTSRLRTRS